MLHHPLNHAAAELTRRSTRAPIACLAGVVGSALLAVGAVLYGVSVVMGLDADTLGGLASTLLVVGAGGQALGWLGLHRHFEVGAGPIVGVVLAPVVVGLLWLMPEASDSRALIAVVFVPLALAAGAYVTSGALADGWGFGRGSSWRSAARTTLFVAAAGLVTAVLLAGAPAALQVGLTVLGFGALAAGHVATAAVMGATA